MWVSIMPNRAFQRTTRQVLQAISTQQAGNPYVDIAATELAVIVDCAPKTVQRAVAALERQGRLKISRSDRGRINRYAVIPEP